MRKATTAVLRKTLVFITGIPLLILGIILIPVPGPGLLLCLLALLLLSIEFEWAKPFRDKAQEQFKKLTDEARAQIEKAKQD